MSAHDLVVDATERLFNRKDLSVVDERFGPVYVQHSALGPDGVDGLKGLLASLPETSSYELVRVLADGDLVVTEGVFSGFAPVPLTGYDVWRLDGDRVVEHWDALGPGVARTSPETPTPEDADPSANRKLVTAWIEDVLIGRAQAQEVPAVGFDPTVTYVRLHTVIADRDLVYTRSEGDRGGAVIVNDVWRLEDGRIVERWGLTVPVPANLPHDNGSF